MGMLQEFKEFAVKGNVIDLAVGVIIGGAFGKIVGSLVDDVIMPLVGLVFGKLDFSNLFVVLGAAPEGTARTLAAMKAAGPDNPANRPTAAENGQRGKRVGLPAARSGHPGPQGVPVELPRIARVSTFRLFTFTLLWTNSLVSQFPGVYV